MSSSCKDIGGLKRGSKEMVSTATMPPLYSIIVDGGPQDLLEHLVLGNLPSSCSLVYSVYNHCMDCSSFNSLGTLNLCSTSMYFPSSLGSSHNFSQIHCTFTLARVTSLARLFPFINIASSYEVCLPTIFTLDQIGFC